MLNICSLLNPNSVPILPDATVLEWLIKLHSAVGGSDFFLSRLILKNWKIGLTLGHNQQALGSCCPLELTPPHNFLCLSGAIDEDIITVYIKKALEDGLEWKEGSSHHLDQCLWPEAAWVDWPGIQKYLLEEQGCRRIVPSGKSPKGLCKARVHLSAA
uniref:Uncharacterized protein n=1 Tax=Molossus molossus TaxID=27622 RepID=A0A7J8F9N9_MOLMO|nr:hypothetical protein HJG59_008589 [Molossus molossus]